MAKYLKLYYTKESAVADDSIMSPTTILCLQNNQTLSYMNGVDGTLLQAKQHTSGATTPDLYFIVRPTEPPHNIHFICDGQTVTVVDNKFPNPLPVPTIGEHKTFKGWYLDNLYTVPATPGMTIHEDTYVYGKVISETLTFFLKSASDASKLSIEEVSGMTINGTAYTNSELSESHYNAETKYFTFVYPGDTVVYTVNLNESSGYQDKNNIMTSYTSLNNMSIPMIPKGTTLGDVTAIVNWEVNQGGSDSYIFDLYTAAYEGAAPNPNDETTSATKRVELSWQYTGSVYNYPQTGDKDFDIKYTTFTTDWSRGEYTTINIPNGTTLEDLFRKYSFVFIVNDYAGAKPNTSNPSSQFRKQTKNMSIYVQIGSYNATINLTLPEGTDNETGDQSGNWIAFKTKLLDQTQTLSKIEDAIEVFSNGQYSFMDSRKDSKTFAYDLNNGGRGVIG